MRDDQSKTALLSKLRGVISNYGKHEEQNE